MDANMPALEIINYYYYPSVRIDATQKIKSRVFRSALYWVEAYVNGLVLQWNRMVDDVTRSNDLIREDLMLNAEAAKATGFQVVRNAAQRGNIRPRHAAQDRGG